MVQIEEAEPDEEMREKGYINFIGYIDLLTSLADAGSAARIIGSSVVNEARPAAIMLLRRIWNEFELL